MQLSRDLRREACTHATQHILLHEVIPQQNDCVHQLISAFLLQA